MKKLRDAKLEAERMATALSSMSQAMGSAVSTYGASILIAGGQMVSQMGLQDVEAKMADAESEFTGEMQIRKNAETLTTCFNETDMLKLGIETAFHQIDRRTTDYLSALGRFNTQAQALHYAISDGRNTVWREKNRTFPPIAFHFWKHDKSVTYQLEFKAAQKVAYLALLAMEYDYQASLPGRNEILTATSPTQLEAIVGLPGLVGAGAGQGMLGGFTRQVASQQRPSQDPVVLSLRELLGLKGVDAAGISGEQRLTELVSQSSSAAYDVQTGEYLGQAVHFSISPENVPLQGRCAERVSARQRLATGHAHRRRTRSST